MNDDNHDMKLEMKQNREIIKRFDEVMNEKASKFEISKIYEYLKSFIRVEEDDKRNQEVESKFEQFDKVNERTKKTLQRIDEKIFNFEIL